jgi:hypothetical protein
LEHDFKPVQLSELRALKEEIQDALTQFREIASEVLERFWHRS